jgi:hypothetical protein
MDAPRLLPVALVAAFALLLVPLASAHSPAYSADNHVRAVIGQLNEPVSTYAVSGLDICFTTNPADATKRVALAVANPGDFSATLTAPNGLTLHQDLKGQFGRTGCLTFAEPYVLTQPGQYFVALSGAFNGTTFAATGITAGGAVVDRANITFPDSSVASDQALQARIDALQARVDTLEAAKPAKNSLPMPAAAWLLVALACLAAVRRAR